MTGFADTDAGQSPTDVVQCCDGVSVGMWAGFEARHCALEKELITRNIVETERDETSNTFADDIASGVSLIVSRHMLSELLRCLTEHRVIDGVLGFEVHIQGRGSCPRPFRQVSHGQSGETRFCYYSPRRVDDGVTG